MGTPPERLGVGLLVCEDSHAISEPVAVGILPIRHGIKPYPRIARYIHVFVNATPKRPRQESIAPQ